MNVPDVFILALQALDEQAAIVARRLDAETEREEVARDEDVETERVQRRADA